MKTKKIPTKVKFYTKDDKPVFFKARKTASMKSKQIKAWAVLGLKGNAPEVYIQKTKPSVVRSSSCEYKCDACYPTVVKCTITYNLPLIKK